MHKIKLGAAPISIVKLFSVNDDPTARVTMTLTDQHTKRLRRLEINQANIISRIENIIPYFNEPYGRLKVRINLFGILGPKLYNYFTTKANTQTSCLTKSIRHENIGLNGFKNRMKSLIVLLQSRGDEHLWDLDNYPLYTITSRDMALQSDNVTIVT